MKRLALSVAAGGLLFACPLFSAGTAFAASTPMAHAATTKAATHKATKTKTTKTVAAKPAVHKTVVHRAVVHRTVVERMVLIPAVVMVRAAVGLLIPVFISALIGVSIIL
jgi:hypothetical protein